MLCNIKHPSEKADTSRKLMTSAHGRKPFPGLKVVLRKIVRLVSLSWKAEIFTWYFERTIYRNFVITTKSSFRQHLHLRNTPSTNTIKSWVTTFQNAASLMDKNIPEIHVLQIRLKILNKLTCQLGRFVNFTFRLVPVWKIHQTPLHVKGFVWRKWTH
jgi:hypothetical protein